MPHNIKGLFSSPLSASELGRAMRALPAVLERLLGDSIITAYYGWDCNLHPDLQYVPMRVPIRTLERFIEDSLSQQMVVLGRSDFSFVVPEKRLEILFCHEGDIHLDGRDDSLIKSVRDSAVFADVDLKAAI